MCFTELDIKADLLASKHILLVLFKLPLAMDSIRVSKCSNIKIQKLTI